MANEITTQQRLPKTADKSDSRNPFVALEGASGELASLHERLIELTSRLAGPPAPFKPPDALDTGGGLLGVSCSASRVMQARLGHIQRLVDQIEEFLQ